MERALAEHARKQAQTQQQRRSAQQQRQQQQRQQQQQQPRQSTAKADDDRRQLRQKVEALQAELAAAKTQARRSDEVAGVDDEMDEPEDGNGYSSWTPEERNKRVELARGGLAYATAAFGEDSAQAQGFREEINALQRASREAKPFKTHRNLLERRRDELRRKQERDESAVEAAKAEIEELQCKVGTLQLAIDDRAKQLRAVTDELTELVRKSLSDDGDGDDDELAQSTAAQSCAPWTALAAAAKGVAGFPGMPAEVAALLAQLQQVASTVIANSATAAAAGRAASADSQPGGTVPTAASTTTDAKQKPSSSGAPVVLAPHGRFNKSAAKGGCPPPPRPQPATPPAGAGNTGEGQASGSDATKAAAAAAGAATAAEGASDETTGATGNNDARDTGNNDGDRDEDIDDSDAEMVAADADGDDDGSTTAEIERSLSKLPARDRRRLRAAIRGGGQRTAERKEGGEGSADGESGRRERERSPRPTKVGDKDL